jgi:hypothetical protein
MDKRKKRKQHARVILIAMVTRQEGDEEQAGRDASQQGGRALPLLRRGIFAQPAPIPREAWD